MRYGVKVVPVDAATFLVYERLIHPAPDFNLPHPFFSSTMVYLFFFPATSRIAPTTLLSVPAPERMFSTSQVVVMRYGVKASGFFVSSGF